MAGGDKETSHRSPGWWGRYDGTGVRLDAGVSHIIDINIGQADAVNIGDAHTGFGASTAPNTKVEKNSIFIALFRQYQIFDSFQ